MKTEKEIKERLRLAEESRKVVSSGEGLCMDTLWQGRIEALKWVLEE